MKKEVFVTAGLCRIKDQIAEAARNSAEKTADTPSGEDRPAAPVSVFETLPEETRKALRARWQEYEHFRQDLSFRLHEFSAGISRMETETRRNAEALQNAKSALDTLLHRLEQQQELDEFAPNFQMHLAENFRELDRMRLDLIQIQALKPAENPAENRKGTNLFAELDSVSFGQLFRIGTALFLPLTLAIVFSTLLLILAIALTFRIGL